MEVCAVDGEWGVAMGDVRCVRKEVLEGGDATDHLQLVLLLLLLQHPVTHLHEMALGSKSKEQLKSRSPLQRGGRTPLLPFCPLTHLVLCSLVSQFISLPPQKLTFSFQGIQVSLLRPTQEMKPTLSV